MTIKREDVLFEGLEVPVYSLNTLVIGSGAAGLAAALRLHDEGQRDIAIVTEQWGGGTSFNAGSDKQTYYKLSLAGGVPDSPRKMAQDLYDGGCMHGDIALCEAQHSVEAFFNLVRLGVPFPHDRYGAYVGYRTDHDRVGRASSAGPLTSRIMGECLGDAVCARGFPVLDGHAAVSLLWSREQGRKRVCGAVVVDLSRVDDETFGMTLFNAENVILATGGPGGMYGATVYPESQSGSTGLGLAVGAAAQNLTESQFGLASVGFRWNVSGSYQQAIPRYVSTDARGGDPQDFLNEFFPDMTSLAGAIFRKGYEWPFDADKVAGFGSSLIDVLVYRETVQRGRRVFLDFTRNPAKAFGLEEFAFDRLDGEARAYLERSGALQEKPVDRLEAMNPQALALFRDNGTDLTQDRLEIAVCAQHSNGGLAANIWWESNIRHLFPVGEVCGTHGVRRPGGAALNAGQVGAIRAAMFIARRYRNAPADTEDFIQRVGPQVRACTDYARLVSGAAPDTEEAGTPKLTPQAAIDEVRARMSTIGAHIRDPLAIADATGEAWHLYARVLAAMEAVSRDEVPLAFRARDLCLTHAFYLEAMQEYFAAGGRSRGSCLVLDSAGSPPCDRLGDRWRFSLADPDDIVSRKILEMSLDDDSGPGVLKRWVDIRPIPDEDGWFEEVWKNFAGERIYKEE